MALVNQTVSALSDVMGIFSAIPGVGDIINIIKAIGILIALYVVFLIIRAISQISMASRLKVLANNVQEINNKMDLLVGKKNSRKEKK